jgi:hypothetical protein
LEIVQNPDTANVVFDRENLMRGITTAGYRIATTDYVTTFPAHRFQGSLGTMALGTSTNAKTNPYGFDVVLYMTGGTLSADYQINGQSINHHTNPCTIRLPRDATITWTGSGAPTAQAFAD